MSLPLPQANSCPVNVNTFPGKLWKLVNDPHFESIIWGYCETTLLINAQKFKEEVLGCGKYSVFKTQNFSSFVRQLNLYGFRKLSSTPTKLSGENSRSPVSLHPVIHCFAHDCFLRHRPDLLPQVRRAPSSTTKRRPSPKGKHGTSCYAGQYGNTFRILGRCENNSSSPFSGQIQTHINGSLQPQTMTSQNLNEMKETPSKLSATCRSRKTHSKSSETCTSCSKQPSPYKRCPDLGASDDDKASTPVHLFQPSSANVLWGQGFVGQPSSEEDSPLPSPQLTLIAKAEKGTVKAIRTPPEAASFPSCLYDAHGRLQKFVVIQQSPSPRFGAAVPRISSGSPSMAVDSNGRQAVSPCMWPSLYSGQYMPVGLDADPYYGYQQMVDYSALQYPYGYGAGYMGPFGPECIPSFGPTENMMQGAGYFKGDGMALSGSPPIFPGGPPGSMMPPHASYQYQPAAQAGTQTPRDAKPKPGSQSRKVVVKQEAESHPHLLSAMVREERGGLDSRLSAPDTACGSGRGGRDKQEE